jgi:uncharacterized membrane protein
VREEGLVADIASALKGQNGVAFLVAAGLTYEVVAAACSSPQTTEINADSRAKTLMKWVYIGLGQAAVLVLIAAKLEPSHFGAFLFGGALAGIMMYLSYLHARSAGMKSCEPGTES